MNKKYYEFNDFEYYGLVTVTEEYEGEDLLDKAYQVYLRDVAGETLEELKQEGVAKEISVYDALEKCANSSDAKNMTVSEFLSQFTSHDNVYLLIDGSLI